MFCGLLPRENSFFPTLPAAADAAAAEFSSRARGYRPLASPVATRLPTIGRHRRRRVLIATLINDSRRRRGGARYIPPGSSKDDSGNNNNTKSPDKVFEKTECLNEMYKLTRQSVHNNDVYIYIYI